MTMLMTPAPSPTRPAKRFAFAAAIWLGAGTLGGFAIAAISGEHGSAIFFILGAVLGLAGVISHGALQLTSWFRRSTYPVRVLATWLACILLLLPPVLWSLAQSEPRFFIALSEALSVLVYAAVPAGLISALAVRACSDAA